MQLMILKHGLGGWGDVISPVSSVLGGVCYVSCLTWTHVCYTTHTQEVSLLSLTHIPHLLGTPGSSCRVLITWLARYNFPRCSYLLTPAACLLYSLYRCRLHIYLCLCMFVCYTVYSM